MLTRQREPLTIRKGYMKCVISTKADEKCAVGGGGLPKESTPSRLTTNNQATPTQNHVRVGGPLYPEDNESA